MTDDEIRRPAAPAASITDAHAPAGSTFWLSTPARFLFAGGLAAAVNFASRFVLSVWLPYPIAIVVAYVIGMATAFVLNRRYVFRSATTPLPRQVAWFVAINVLAVAQTLAVSLLLAGVVLPRIGLQTHVEAIAHAIGIAVPIVTSYLGHKHWTFR